MVDIKREQVEPMYEDRLLRLTREFVKPDPAAGQPDTRTDEDLRRAEDFFLTWFGGKFPAAGLSILRATGQNASRDKLHLPEAVHGELRIYYPSMPLRGANSKQEDLTGKAKDLTRLIRNRVLERWRASEVGPYLYVEESVGGDRIGPGIAQATEKAHGDRYIVWVDRTTFSIEVSL